MIEPSRKLAIILPDLVVGGAERSMIKLAGGLAERGYQVDFILANARGPLLEEVPSSVRLIDLGARRALTSLPGLIRYLRLERPEALLSVLHTNLVTLWAGRLSRVNTRIVVSERNTLSKVSQNSSSDMRYRIMPQLARRFYPWAKYVVAVSQGVADDLVESLNLSRAKIKVIYNPIITPEFETKVKASLDHPWFRPGEPPVVLAVGRLSAQKGFDSLIRAFEKVIKVLPARLLILGNGEDRPELEAFVSQLGLGNMVSLPGFELNPYPYMVRANVFVLSSRWEGLPGVLIEALYCGASIVSTDCPSGAREILANGKYGRLVPVDDIGAMAQAIVIALKNGTANTCKESWQPYTLDTIVDQYIGILFN